ncbi:hypothetical protein BN863_32520 [Formosa agariphila KMM 3901]|uniref:Uncharacterized protein n=1 Tax=Formosa agariphila (strain DSM 15362 / KCTC 12365 / LMG 23005 / KMM 3901 / M-2Alg 35-1) TaxID=1347342 RepID=T2KS59_FORAG|nr:hypothetical protein [Formosa agariphila]CDF80964.1 hypothetical protein BN863_32520 [Formosa agariphila KMM 3901]
MGQYVDAIAMSLLTWDIEYGTGGDLGWDYYRSMALGGLFQVDSNGNIVTETDAFKALVPELIDRQNISKTLTNEQNGNSNAKGTKCD